MTLILHIIFIIWTLVCAFVGQDFLLLNDRFKSLLFVASHLVPILLLVLTIVVEHAVVIMSWESALSRYFSVDLLQAEAIVGDVCTVIFLVHGGSLLL